MRGVRFFWGRHGLRLVGGFAAPLLLSVASGAFAAEPPPPLAAAPPAVAAPAPLTLRDARQIAVDRQPAVVAARATLAAASDRSRAVENLRLAALLSRDLPIRRKQAALGVSIAEAGVVQAEWEARYAATYSYLAVLYADDQIDAAKSITERLTNLRDLAQATIDDKEGRKDVSKAQVDLANSYLVMVEGRRQEALQGKQRALAALREALGYGPDCPIVLATKDVPGLEVKVDRDYVVQVATARRGEVIQTATARGVFCLEVDAQRSTWLPSARTFASGSDIHSMPLPAASHEPDYKPGSVGPEMPTTLNGKRNDRVDQARDYLGRADAVADKTRNLVALEAEDAFLRWKQWEAEAPKLEQAAEGIEQFSNDLNGRYNNKKVGYPAFEDLFNAGLRATQARIDANQAHFHRLTSLANLERVTAGGVDPGFEK